MGFFNRKFKGKRALTNIFAISLFIFGFIFGCIYYFYGDKDIIGMFGKLFFVNKEGYSNDYDFYILVTSIYIAVSLFVSTSFVGTLFDSFIIFTKGMHISIGTIFLFNDIHISVSDAFLSYFPQLLLEVVIIYVISIITLRLSINSFRVSFIINDNFNTKKIINYILDYLIIILILLTLTMLFRVYLI